MPHSLFKNTIANLLLLFLAIICSFGFFSKAYSQEDALSSQKPTQSLDANEPAVEGKAFSLPSMDNATLDIIIRRIDPDVKGGNGYWEMRYEGAAALVVTDQTANRMRIIAQVAVVEGLDQDTLFRVLQANFDTALDARFAIANGILWSAFIHPLGSLDEAEFISGFAQTVTLARNFGVSYSSGALRFRGGDTEVAEQELYQQIIEAFESSGQAI